MVAALQTTKMQDSVKARTRNTGFYIGYKPLSPLIISVT